MKIEEDSKAQRFCRIFPQCRALVPVKIWEVLADQAATPEHFVDIANEKTTALKLPGYLGELARLELNKFSLKENNYPVPQYATGLTINPSLKLLDNTWKNLAFLFDADHKGPEPHPGEERIIMWRHPSSGKIRIKSPSQEDLLALKMALEELSVEEVARQGGVHVATIKSALLRALADGLVIGPEPRIKRDYNPANYSGIDPSFYTARIFSLQWHVTQACDLHCRHCYDRNQYASLTLEQEIGILDRLDEFCAAHNVHGQVSFSGGNPLLHPNFTKLYQEAAGRGFTTAILGNPASREQIEHLNAIQPPAFYQVSLEGLEEHNDYIRGKGHFQKVLSFLPLLQEQGIFSMVMLTLTRDNMDQVLPLTAILRDKTDLFTFNRLSAVGEGANLATVAPDKYPGFLEDYVAAVGKNPCLGIKDNLLNLVYKNQNRPLFGGCTGFGCGAAFNFITVLADGAVHACRKFPSPLGNILDKSLSRIYHSKVAERYRRGAVECQDCAIRPVCGGCLAVAHSHGREIFREKDPYCFMDFPIASG